MLLHYRPDVPSFSCTVPTLERITSSDQTEVMLSYARGIVPKRVVISHQWCVKLRLFLDSPHCVLVNGLQPLALGCFELKLIECPTHDNATFQEKLKSSFTDVRVTV